MNIYRVTKISTGEIFEGTTDQVMDNYYITQDALYWHAKNKKQYAGYLFEKIGVNKRPNKQKQEPIYTTTNQGLDDDLRKANLLGVSYGIYKNMQKK